MTAFRVRYLERGHSCQLGLVLRSHAHIKFYRGDGWVWIRKHSIRPVVLQTQAKHPNSIEKLV